MTTDQQVEQQLQQEYQKFENEVYNGSIAVPKDIIELLKKGTMALAPHFHQVLASKIKGIAGKEPKNLTNTDLHFAIKIIVNTPLHVLYGDDFDLAINSHTKFERFLLSYNQSVEEFQKALQTKKQRLLSLSGKTNGMRIIPSGQA